VLFALPTTLSQNVTGTREGWQLDGNTRSSQDILWSSLATIFVCTWTVLHLNAPGFKDPERKILLRRIKWFITVILAPEIVIAMALNQFLESRRSVAAFAKYGRETEIETSKRPSKTISSNGPAPLKDDLVSGNEVSQRMEKNNFEGTWTLTHGYLSTMAHWLSKQTMANAPCSGKMTF